MQIPKEILERCTLDEWAPGKFKILEIAPDPCESCGIALESQRKVEIIVSYFPFKHTRHKCSICKKYYNPVDKEFQSIPTTELAAIIKAEMKKIDK